MADVEIGIGKSGRRAYGFDEISIVPSRRTRIPKTSTCPGRSTPSASRCRSWRRPPTASCRRPPPSGSASWALLGVLHLEGLWTRYADPESELAADRGRVRGGGHRPPPGGLRAPGAARPRGAADQGAEGGRHHRRRRLHPPAHAGAGPAHPPGRARPAGDPGHGGVRRARARHSEPLNLKDFIRHYEIPVVVGGCTSYQAALHLMRTGAAGVLVGAGSGAAGTTGRVLGVGIPMATAISDARAARMRHLDETGVYVHVIADGGMTTGGDMAKAIVCGADA